MVYHDPFRRLVFSGRLFTKESWAFGLTLRHDGVGDGSNPDAVGAGIIAAAEAFIVSANIGDACHLDTIKYNLIGVDGHYVNTTETIRYDYPTPPAGTAAAAAAPQLALCISLMTAVARGPGHAGRFYVPMFYGALDSEGLISTSIATTMASRATALLNAVNADSEEWHVAVESNVGEGHQNDVTHVRVGRVVDTIRSRRTSLVESYITGAALA